MRKIRKKSWKLRKKKEKISKDANKEVPKYDFFQEFCTINEELKGNESVSKGIIGLLYHKKSFY